MPLCQQVPWRWEAGLCSVLSSLHSLFHVVSTLIGQDKTEVAIGYGIVFCTSCPKLLCSVAVCCLTAAMFSSRCDCISVMDEVIPILYRVCIWVFTGCVLILGPLGQKAQMKVIFNYKALITEAKYSASPFLWALLCLLSEIDFADITQNPASS